MRHTRIVGGNRGFNRYRSERAMTGWITVHFLSPAVRAWAISARLFRIHALAFGGVEQNVVAAGTGSLISRIEQTDFQKRF